MLVLFKPFVKFTDLFNGITWEDSYLNANFSPHLSQKITNIKEMHIGLNAQAQERDSNDFENNEDDIYFQVHHNDEDDYEEVQLIKNETEAGTMEAMEIFNEIGWLDSQDSIEFTNIINANHATLKQQQQ